VSQFCIHCGTENTGDATFCRNCGEQLKTEETAKFEEAEQTLKEEEKYKSFGGWLLFYAILLVFGNIISLGYIINTYAGNEFSTTFENIYMAGMIESASYLSWIVVVELIAYYFLLLFTINFFMKSPIIKSLMIIYSFTAITSVIISIFLLLKIDSNMSDSFADILKAIISSIFTIIWMFYFIFSKRVKKTFVAKDGNEPENSLVVTVIFALLIPGYFGYKHFETVSNIKSLANNSEKLTDKALELNEDKKYNEAILLLEKASHLGNARAKASLCNAYIYGLGVEVNFDTAKPLCKEAYNLFKNDDDKMGLNNLLAQYLGDIYFQENDFKDAKLWYTNAMESLSSNRDKAIFIYKVANKYFDAKHFTTSAYWYQKAVEYGEDSAMFRLAYSYAERGKEQLAIKYYMLQKKIRRQQ